MKKVLKMIGIVAAVLALLAAAVFVYLSRKPAVPSEYWKKIKSEGRIESKYNSLGTYSVEMKEYDAPHDERDKGDNHFVIWYPDEEGTYPLLVMINGTGVPCQKYEDVFRHFASWGYVVIGSDYGTNWDGRHASEALDFALGKEEIAEKVDKNKIAVGGHSQGGMGTFNAITEYENGSLYRAAFALSPTNAELAAGLKWGFSLGTENEYAFRLENIKIPMMIAAGTGPFDSETVSPLDKMRDEFDSLGADKVMFRRSDDTDHADMLYEANGYVIAWLDYYLKDVKENGAAFFGENPEISVNNRYRDFMSQEK